MSIISPPRKKVAIIGSGCSGIAALWALNRTHHDVFLYEAADKLGGHTNTVLFKKGKYTTAVDTGFIVLNSATYPNFIAFLKHLKVPISPTEMTFSVSRDSGLFEWAGSSLAAVFAQRRNILSPRLWRMLLDIVRFNYFALDLLRDEDKVQAEVNGSGSALPRNLDSIGKYLEREGYSDAFRDDYLIPMTAAVWSTAPDKCALEFPAVTLVRFMWNHHLLNTITERPQWLTLTQGSKSYIDAVMKGFPSNHFFLKSPVKSVTTEEDGRVRVRLEKGGSELYDHVVIATHGDQALQLIKSGATQEEKGILGEFKTSPNTAVLHSDLSLMPKREIAWTSWNYITKTSGNSANVDQVCLTYDMNIIQNIPRKTFGDVLVTLNPLHEPDEKTVQGWYSYRHPLYTTGAIRSQAQLYRIQNTRGISFCGAWTKYGFHEDGFSSGLYVAQEHLGAKLPFAFTDSTFSRGRNPTLSDRDRLVRSVVLFIQLLIEVFAWLLELWTARRVKAKKHV